MLNLSGLSRAAAIASHPHIYAPAVILDDDHCEALAMRILGGVAHAEIKSEPGKKKMAEPPPSRR
jgi:hypothetical protein